MRNPRPFTGAIVLLAVGVALLSAQTAKPKPKGPVMREPFNLRLKVDKVHYEQVHYDKQPYVSDNEVYLFSGEKFGVNLVVKDARVVEVRYQPNVTKADVVFGFEQPKELQDGLGMALTIDNKMKRGVSMEALMTIPGKKDPVKTNILPVQAGKSGLESWPHPIWQLVLGNLQLTKESASEPKK